MTTRYKAERAAGRDKRGAVTEALAASIPSILVSGMGLFAATFGVALYSDIDIISSMCMLMARGALISMGCVIFFLPALLMLFDGLIRHTTFGMKPGSKATAKQTAVKDSPETRFEATGSGESVRTLSDSKDDKSVSTREALKYIGIIAGVGLGIRMAFKYLKALFL